MMTFPLLLKKIKIQGPTKIKFDLEKTLKWQKPSKQWLGEDLHNFRTLLNDADDTEVVTLIDIFNIAMTETASDILGEPRAVKKKKKRGSKLTLNQCDERKALKKGRLETAAVAEKYREVNNEIKYSIKKAKGSWIDVQCQDVKDNIRKNNSKKA